MANNLCALQRQGTSRLRIIPIETDHDADLGRPDIPDLKSCVAGRKEQRFFKKQMGLAIAPDKPRRANDHSGVIAGSPSTLRKAGDNRHPTPLR